MPFVLIAVKKMQMKYLFAGGLPIGAMKYYSVKEYYKNLNEDSTLIDYWKKSKKFQADLNKVDRYVKALRASE